MIVSLKRNVYRVNKFVHESLRHDGITILRLLSDNAGDVVAADVVERLWKMWKDVPIDKGNNNNNTPMSAQALSSSSVDSVRKLIGQSDVLNNGYHESSPGTCPNGRKTHEWRMKVTFLGSRCPNGL